MKPQGSEPSSNRFLSRAPGTRDNGWRGRNTQDFWLRETPTVYDSRCDFDCISNWWIPIVTAKCCLNWSLRNTQSLCYRTVNIDWEQKETSGGKSIFKWWLRCLLPSLGGKIKLKIQMAISSCGDLLFQTWNHEHSQVLLGLSGVENVLRVSQHRCKIK